MPIDSSVKPVAAGDLGGQRKMRRRRLVQRRDAHQARNRRDRSGRGRRRERHPHPAAATPAFCGSAPVLISTKSSGGRACAAISLASASARLARSTEWMASNSATASLRLVRLQRADQMQFEIAVAGHQRRPLGLGLLHPVFAEYALAGGNHRLDRVGAERLRHRHQRHACRIATGVAAGARDFRAHRRKSAPLVHAFHFVNGFANGSNFNDGAKPVFTHFH